MTDASENLVPLESADDVLRFWFDETPAVKWFEQDDVFDSCVRARGMTLFEQAADLKLAPWRDDARGALAEIILLDQFPRNMFRGSPRTYATDGLALMCAEYALGQGFDQALSPMQRRFFYLPFQHSENTDDQARQAALFAALDDAETYKWSLRHQEIVDRFGRFPHRNAVLGRETTSEEAAFLLEPNSSF